MDSSLVGLNSMYRMNLLERFLFQKHLHKRSGINIMGRNSKFEFCEELSLILVLVVMMNPQSILLPLQIRQQNCLT